MRRVAEQLHLTPAAVSHSLSKLERDFGMSLIVRGRGSITLTEQGQALLPHIRSTLASEARLRTELGRMKSDMSSVVRIGTVNSVCCAWLPVILQRMRALMPKVSVQICQGGYTELENGLVSGSLDLAFVSLPTRRALSSIPLMQDRLLCITPPDFEPENGSYITIEEMKRFDLIIPGPGYDFDAISFIEENGLGTNTTHSVIEDSSIIALVESGLGLSIMPELVLERNGGNIRVYPIESAPYRHLGIAVAQNSAQTAPVSTMQKLIIDFVNERYSRDMPYFR